MASCSLSLGTCEVSTERCVSESSYGTAAFSFARDAHQFHHQFIYWLCKMVRFFRHLLPEVEVCSYLTDTIDCFQYSLMKRYIFESRGSDRHGLYWRSSAIILHVSQIARDHAKNCHEKKFTESFRTERG